MIDESDLFQGREEKIPSDTFFSLFFCLAMSICRKIEIRHVFLSLSLLRWTTWFPPEIRLLWNGLSEPHTANISSPKNFLQSLSEIADYGFSRLPMIRFD